MGWGVEAFQPVLEAAAGSKKSGVGPLRNGKKETTIGNGSGRMTAGLFRPQLSGADLILLILDRGKGFTMTEREYETEANRMAEKANYDSAEKTGIAYKGMDVYEGTGHQGDVPGYPMFLLAGAGRVRRADIHETCDIMGIMTKKASCR